MQLKPLYTGKKNISYINSLIKTSELWQLEQYQDDNMLVIARTSHSTVLYCVKHGIKTLGYTNDADIAFQWLHNGNLFTQREAKEISKTGWKS